MMPALIFSFDKMLGCENGKERLRKLKAVTAEETREGQDAREDEEENALDNSDEDETFELMDQSETQENGKKRKGRNIKKGKEKKKKLKGKEDVSEENLKKKEKIKGKKKKNISKRNSEEDVKEKTAKNKDLEKKSAKKKKKIKEMNQAVLKSNTEEANEIEKITKVRKKKRKIAEENGTNEKSKKSKKAKMVKSGLDEDIGEVPGQGKVFEDGREKLLIEGDEVDDHELSPADMLDMEIANAPEVVDKKNNLNPKNVFQIEDLGRQNDLLNYTVGEDSDSDMHAQRMTIQEAFANDDVIEEFVKEKDEETERSKTKDLDTSLPGWGDWGGPGIDETKRRKKFTVPAKPGPPRKDSKLAHVIINEDRDKKFAKNQVIW